MFAFINFVLMIFAGGGSGGGGWWAQYGDRYLNYPGFEAWKFLNLAIFLGVIVYLLKKPLSEAFKAKRETIRAELIKAEEEKKAALARMTATEAKLARLDEDEAAILAKAKAEAEAEAARIAREAEDEIARLRRSAEAEIARKSAQVRVELRKFSAEESIRLAEEKIRRDIDATKDAKLVKATIAEIGGLN